MKKINILLSFVIALVAFCSCSDDYDPQYTHQTTVPISTYLESKPEFSEYVGLLKYADMFNALNQSSSGVSFTAFAPTNEAMQAFYQQKGISSYTDMTVGYARSFVLYHTVLDSITADKFVLKTSVTNLSENVLPISFNNVASGEADIADGHIVQMGLSAYNGKVYVLSKAMTPLVETIYDRLSDGKSDIMREAVDASGYKKLLSTYRDTVKVTKDGKTSTVINTYNYTFLNVSDETFAKAGVTSLAALRQKLEADTKEDVDADSLLREYVGYHILNNNREQIADNMKTQGAVSSLIDTKATNQVIAVAMDTLATDASQQLLLNGAGAQARFIADAVQKAKNGYVEQLDSYLPVWEPDQTTVLWDMADNAAIKAIIPAENYQPKEPDANEQRFSVYNAPCFTYKIGEAGTKNRSYSTIDYVTCKSNLKNAHNHDRLVFNLGYMGSVSMQTPTLVKGKYKVEMTIIYLTSHNFMRQQTDGNGGLLKLDFDGDSNYQTFASPYTKVPSALPGVYTSTVYDEVEFSQTASHKFNMVVMDPAASSNSGFSIQIDCITFTPIK